MLRELPKINLSERDFQKEFFFDERLRQIRNVDNPFDYFDLSSFEVQHIKDVLLCGHNEIALFGE